MVTVEKKREIIEKFGRIFGNGEKDSGRAEVQVAILTHRINDLKGHFDKHIHDYHANRGLLKMIGHRRSLLRYIQQKDHDKYKKLIGELGLRK